MSKQENKKRSKFVGVPSRRERRALARQNKTKFVPLYNLKETN